LWAAVAGRVLIYIHKNRSDDVERYPARHYVMVTTNSHLTAIKVSGA
jgi:hypothetical protein